MIMYDNICTINTQKYETLLSSQLWLDDDHLKKKNHANNSLASFKKIEHIQNKSAKNAQISSVFQSSFILNYGFYLDIHGIIF